MGFRPAWLWTLFAGLGEFVGGLLLALGLLIPIGPLAIIAVMLMAIAKAHWPKLWVTEGGFEYPLVNIAVAVVIGLLGAGRISLDAVLGTQLPLPVSFWIGLAIVIIGWLAGVLTSQRSAERPAERPSELEQRRAA
jgi:putative oxidoreductase